MELICVIIIFSVVVYGISNMFVNTSGPFDIFDGIKLIGNKIHPSLLHLMSCMICFPTWVGMILSIINMFFIPEYSFTPGYSLINNSGYWWMILIIDASFASGINWIFDTVQLYLEKKTSEDKQTKNLLND